VFYNCAMLKKLLLVLLVILLASCGKKKEDEKIVEANPIKEVETNKEDIKYSDDINFNQTWVFNGGGYYTSVNEDKYNKEIQVKDDGGSLSYNNLHLISDHNYKLYFDIFANKEKNVNVSIRNSDDEVLVSKDIMVNEETSSHEIEFACNQQEDWNYKIVFSFPEGDYFHAYLNNLFIKDLDNETHSIKTNHLGYTLNQIKQAVFPGNMGDAFYVINDDTSQRVYRGIIGNAKEEKETGEYNSKGYFSEVNKEGNYYLISESGQESQVFSIKDGIYSNVLNDALNFFYLQRCGSDLSQDKAGELVHSACHTTDAEVVGFGHKIDVTGGWHDAGDYGRYVKTGTEALANLLLAYYVNPSAFNAQDILEECKYELDWLLKLQKDDGAIYNKVTTKVFADMVMPEDDNNDLYVLQAFTSSTASAAGVFGLGSIVFKEIDNEYSKKLEEASLKSLAFIEGHNENIYYTNPDGFSTGDYPTPDDKSQRAFAYSVGYVLTHKDKYLDKAIEYGDQISFGDNGEGTLKYSGYYLLLKDNKLTNNMYNSLFGALDGVRSESLRKIHENNYPYNGSTYPMGSNKVLLDRVNICFLLNDLKPNEIYRGTGEVALSYIFGNNVLNKTFVTGYGLNYPHNIHHRELKVKGIEVPGFLAPGPSEHLTEGNASKYFNESDPVARRYVDEFDAYYCNEAAILYNAPLVLAISFMCK